ncbi:inverse autotransporter beta domain-containing protein, partial [Klebsiella variicola]|nr:inverse autotransporter beta domain-containing protein [Klebsiella variicola]
MRNYFTSGDPLPGQSTRRFKYTAWLCITMQLFSASTVTISSVVLASTASSLSKLSESQLMSLPARPYVLGAGETPYTVAKSLGLSFSQLRLFNQFRSFRTSFSKLTTGDEIDVPDLAKAKQLSQSPHDKSDQAPAEPASRLAGDLQTAGGILQNNRSGDAAAGMARSMASGAANDAVQQWLSKFGTVRANISLDEHGSLDNSSVDWLAPVYDSPENMLFTQLGARDKDHRATLNAGWGVRWFTPGWMYGFNNFFDDDITGNNRRVGLGFEAKTDYLQLAGNSYMRLNDWHQSRDFKDYDERPANGYDLRAKGWLPAYPQVGGKLVYEQYYGNNVALFGKDNLQHNPYAVTAGVEWTPFPLLTVGVDERMGKGGQNETSMNMQVTWRPGDSLSSQLSSDSVAASRLLASSRYDLVDRNNDIVLEYRKQELIDLSLNAYSITGASGSSWPLSAAVKTKYALKTVSVSADSFTAAGGKIQTLDPQHFSLTLPPYRNTQRAQAARKKVSAPGAASDPNVYLLNVTASDDKGNQSSPQMVTVTVLPPQLTLSGKPDITGDNAIADGKSTIRVGTVVDDGFGHPVPDQQVKFTVTHSDGTTEELTGVTDDKGFVSVDISSTVPGDTTVTISAGGASKDTVIHFADAGIDTGQSTFRLSPSTIIADGKDTAVVTLTARNSKGEPVKGQAGTLRFAATGLKDLAVTKIVESPANSGNYTAGLSGTTAGKATLSPVMGTTPVSGLSAELILTANAGTAGFGGNPGITGNNALANGTDKVGVDFKVTDAGGNPLAGQSVTITTGNGSAPGTVTVVTDSNGIAHVDVTSTTAGQADVTATVNGKTQTVPVNFAADGTTAGLGNTGAGLSTVADNAVADGNATNSVRAVVTDARGNPVAGAAVSFTADNGATVAASGTTGADGSVTVTLKSVTAGQSTVTASINGSSATTATRFIANAGTAGFSGNPVVTGDSAVANGTDKVGVDFKVTDAGGNPLAGQSVTITTGNGSAPGTVTVVTDSNGIAHVDVTSTTAGQADVTATVNGKTQTVPVNFAADGATAGLGNTGAGLSTVADNAVANGTATNSVRAVVTDARGNPVAGAAVSFAADNGATIAAGGTTGADGSVTVTLTSLTAGQSTVTASLNGSSKTTAVTFVADSSNLSATNSSL